MAEIEVAALPVKGPVEHAPMSESAAILSMIERAARDPAVDVDKLERLLRLRNETIARQAEDDFNGAMSDAQGEMGQVSRDSANPQTRSKYASLAALDRALRPIYSKHHFGMSFDTETVNDTTVRVKCFVTHRVLGRPGHTRTYHIDMPADGKGAKGGDVMTKTHATGSAVTYGRRYLLLMIFNIAVGDDDGNAAGHVEQPRITKEQVAELDQLILDVGANKAKFLEYIRCDSLADILASKFADAKKVIQSTKRKT